MATNEIINKVNYDKLEHNTIYNAKQIIIQDQYTEIVNLYLGIFLDDLTILQNTNINDRTILVSCDTLPIVGNYICLKEQSSFYQGRILSVVSNGGINYTLTLDAPLDFAFTTNGGCSLMDVNLNKNGSVTPLIAAVSPQGLNVNWDITRIILVITDNSAMDDGKFGGIAELAKGIVFRRVDGTYKNIFTARNNGDLGLQAYDVSYQDATLGPSGLYSLRMRRSFNGQDKNGIVIRLFAASEDQFQLYIQDNLTALSSFKVIVQGHVVD